MTPALNAWLPEDIRVLSAARAHKDFHARFDATGKQYRYFIWNHPTMNPLIRRTAWHVPRRLDLKALRAAAPFFVGQHDFRAFTSNPGYARKSTIRTLTRCDIKRSGSLLTVIIAHATFCIVVVYNNVLARLRRTQGSLLEAAADLGANGIQTFRDITMPLISTALVAGAMLAFALSFDEVIVTTFTAGAQNTVPIWILAQLRNGQHLPEVNVVVSFVILVTIIPVLVAARLTGGSGAARVQAGR